ncbi:hypothetical protein BVG80_03630 [Sphingobacteriales bacterium TSM_CSM]|nr:hypothetical protein BVG80_03630 [Sphingobacteriales bacterium TSM_CSM]
MGADLTYGCLSNNQYLVILKFFRDCNGISPANSYPVYYGSAQCGVTGSITVNLTPPIPPFASNPQDITPLCPGEESACGGNGQYGVQQWIYSGTLTLPPGCGTDWILGWSECCRNYAITTLDSPGDQSFYVEAHIDNTQPTCNTSPQFLNPPVPFSCVNQPVFYNHGVVDADGDQLVFSLTNCNQAPGSLVDYAGSFNGTTPLTTVSGVTIDPVTGDISFTPNQAQVGVLCVLVEEYRNGIKIGEVVRDMQFTVINCNNNAPVSSGIDGGNVYETTICAGEPLCFDIVSTDANAPNTITASWNAGISGGIFTPGPVANPTTSTFCWTPTTADVGTHFFTVTTQDNACPILGTNVFSYTIVVEPNPNPPVNAGPDVAICLGESVPLNASISGPLPPGVSVISYSWSPAAGLNTTSGASVIATPTVTTVYEVTAVYSDFCQSVDQVQITVDPLPQVNIYPNSNIVVCSGGSIQLNALTSPDVISYQWAPTAGVSNPTSANPTFTPSATSSYTVTVTNVYGCTAEASVTLGVSLPPPDVCTNFYVTPTGSGGGLSPADPTNLVSAITQAACNNATVKMAIGTYTIDNPINIYSNMTLEGGFDPGNNWTKTSQAGATTIHRSALNTEGPVNQRRIVALYGYQISYFRLQDLTISTENAPTTAGSGASTYALHCDGCSNYQIVRTQLLPGLASAGQNGVSTPGTGGAGGGGAGGNGGNDNTGCNADGQNGTAGTAGASGGGNGGNGGGGANGDGCNIFGCGADPTNGNNGVNGQPGGAGTNAPATAPPAPNITAPFFVPGAQSASGTNGKGGGGGGGGGGSSGGTDCTCSFSGNGNGGIGGSGGNGGIGGTGGYGGGGAFGAYLVNNGGGNFIDCNITQQSIAAGGSGSAGQPGTPGAPGTAGNQICCGGIFGGNCSTGGSGGSGGAGGAGGNGQPGAPGVSVKIAVTGTPPQVSVNNANQTMTAGGNNPNSFNLAAQPVITVANVSCTFTNVTYTGGTPAFASLGNGAVTPAGPVTQYNSTGRKTIVLGTNQYVGFHNIAIDGSAPPGILTTATPTGNPNEYFLCQGDAASFTSTISYGLIYHWNLGGAVTPNNYDGPPYESISGLTFNTPGTFTIDHYMETDCCGNSPHSQITLIVDPTPQITSVTASPQNACQGSPVTLTVTGTAASFEWSPASSITPATGNTVTATPSSTTTYQVTALSASGNCIATAEVTVNVLAPPTVSLTATNAVCNANGSVNSSVSGGSGNFSYAWDTNNDDLPDVFTPNLPAVPVGQYSVTITDNVSNCTADASVNVNPAAGSLAAFVQTNSNASCNGIADGEATIGTVGGTPPFTYTWSPNVSSSATATNLAAGNYSVTVNDGGCTSVVSFSIFGPQPLQLQLLNTVPNICSSDANGEAQVDATGGNGAYEFEWNTIPPQPSPISTSGSVTGLQSGTYGVTVTDANGCTDALTVNIPSTGSDDVATLSYSPDNVCQGSGLVINPTLTGVTGGTFTAAPAGLNMSATGSINVDASTSGTAYTITYNTAGAPASVCPVTVTATITIAPNPVLQPIQTDACEGGLVDLEALTPTDPALLFDWFVGLPSAGTNLGTNLLITASSAGPGYWLLATDAVSGCTDSVQLQVNITTPAFTLNPPPAPCYGEEIDLTALNGTGNGTFEWYDNTPSSGNLVTTPVAITAATTFWTEFTETASGCSDSAMITITPAPAPVFTINAPPLPCPGQPIDLTTLNGTGNGTFEWFNGLPSSGSAISNITLTSNINLWVLFTDNTTGCSDSLEVPFTYTPPPFFTTLPPPATCSGSQIDVYALSGGEPGTYEWFSSFPSEGNLITQPVTITADTPVWVLFTQTVTGCTDSAQVILPVAPDPLFSYTVPPQLCIGELLDVNTLNGFEPGTYQWYNDIPSSGSLITGPISYSTSSVVWLQFTDNNTGCTDSSQVLITVSPLPAFSVNTPVAICEGGNYDLTTLNGSGNGAFIWYEGLPYLGNNVPAIVQPQPGNSYWLLFTDNVTGCTDSTEVTLPLTPPPSATLSGGGVICPGQSATITVTITGGAPDYTVTYTNGINTFTENATASPWNIAVSPVANATYTLTGLTDGNSCVATNLTGSATVTLSNSPAFSNLSTLCNATNTGYTVTFTISGGDAATYSVTGSATGSITQTGGVYTFTSNEIPSGSGYNFTLTDAADCNPQIIADPQVLCNCTTSAGTMTSTLLTELCDGQTFTALHNGDETLEPDDAAAYVLHTNSGTSLGTVIAQNPATGTFSFAPPMVYGTTYYVSLVAGNSNGSGGVDFTDPCLDVAQGSPVVFYPLPTAALTGNADICAGEQATLTFTLTGNQPWNITYADNFGNNTTVSATASPFTVTVTPSLSTTYSLAGITDAHCTGTTSGSAAITVHSLPTPAISGNDEICSGQTAILDAGAGYATYLWSDGTTAQTLTVSASGSYGVTVEDAFGCQGSDVFTVQVNTNPAPVIAGTLSFCPGDTSVLDAGSGYDAYLWTNGTTTQTLTVSASGSYGVTVTDANGCTGPAMVTATVFTVSPPTIAGDTDICNYETATLTASAGYTGYIWNTGETTNVITTNTAGNYTVTATDTNGCTSQASVAVTVNAAPTVNIGGSATFCTGGSTTLSATGGLAQYTWLPGGETTPSVTAATAGSYSVTVTNTAGCTASAAVTVSENANLSPVILVNNLCGSTELDAGSGFGSYLWSPGGETSQVITVTTAGVYSVTVSNGATCTGETTLNAVIETPVVVNAGIDTLICGYTYTLQSDGTTGFWTYTGGGTASFTNAGNPITDVTVNACDVYVFTWNEDNGICQSADDVMVGFIDEPQLTGACPPEQEDVCGNSTGINPGSVLGALCTNSNCPEGSVEWNDVLAAFGIDCTPIAGTCHWEWDFIDGPAGTETVSFLPDAFTPDVTVTVTPFGHYRFRWVCDVAGNCPQTCGSVFADKIFNFTEPLTAADNAICDPTPGTFTVSVNIVGGEGPYTVNGAPVAGNVYTETLPSASVYNYQIDDNSVCPPIVIANAGPVCDCPPLPVTVSGITEICPGETTTLNATPGFVSYEWTPGGNLTPDIAVFFAGTYTVNVTDSAGCTGTASATVTENPIPVTDAGPDDIICGLTYTLAAVPAAGGSWSSAAGVVFVNPGNAATAVTVPNFGTYTFTWSVTDPISGCFNTDDVEITFTNSPLVNAGPDDSVCGLTYTLDASPNTGGTWSSAAAGVVFANPGNGITDVTVPGIGTYTFTWTVTGATPDCSGTDNVSILFEEQLTATLVSADCNGPVYSVVIDLSGGNDTNYSVSGVPGSYDAVTGLFTSAPLASGIPYSISITDGSSCAPVVIDGVTDCNCVTYAGTMPLTPYTFCGNGQVTVANNGDEFLDDNDAFTYLLHNGSGTTLGTVYAQNSNGTFTIGAPLEAGVTYYISAVAGNADGAGGIDLTDVCLSVAAGTPVMFDLAITLDPIEPANICAGDSYDLSILEQAGLPGTFTWYNNNPALGATPVNAQIAPVTDATYWVVYEQGGCTDTTTALIEVGAVVFDYVQPDTSILAGQSVVLNASATSGLGGAITISWDGLSGSNPTVSPNQTTTYTVTATDEWGCTATESVTITIIQQNSIIIPNAFSPNGDGFNDIFRVTGYNVAEVEMYIYDRWGNAMYSFTSTDLLQGWDGSKNGVNAELGVYVYYAVATFTDGTQEFVKGNVTLVR